MTKRVLTRGASLCSAVLLANGRIKLGWVYVTSDTGKFLQELHPEGSYYIECCEWATTTVGRIFVRRIRV